MKEYIKKIDPADLLCPYVRYYWAYADSTPFTTQGEDDSRRADCERLHQES